ncbi:thioredoxin family protein [Psychroflexus montanilacus]|uniref:thioredoxin family protein n=1 Tax=Psychroflexus montanilacus TaxID=2873598 RepID=UPI001CC97EC3|nr:thioredoxin family protein [Psychroflexus montanilacus]MBZ9651015.1 thioredoxin family protein [Psychroflexus montanilacus]
MRSIKILGTGCPKCKTMFNNVNKALDNKGVKANVEKIEDIQEIMKYNVLSTPVLVIDEEIKIKGKAGDVSEIESFL